MDTDNQPNRVPEGTNDSALMTSEQIAANATLLQLNQDPAVRAAKATLVAELEQSTAAKTADAKARIAHAVTGWTNTLILREIAADPVNPAILWLCDDTTMPWHDTEIPYRSSSLMNPDRIYRGALFDGAGRYEITGQIDLARPPAEFSFEVTSGTAGKIMMQTANASTADLGDQISMLTGDKLAIEPDGSFRITVGGERAGANHLHTPNGPIAMTLRDALSDWAQRPNRLAIRRLDPTDAKPLDYDEIRRRLLDDLPHWVHFFVAYTEGWLGGLDYNKLRGPVARDGGWGFLAAGRYRVDPGEALIITTSPGSARYTGIQVTDPWLVGPDGIKHQTSLNNTQVAPNPDGSVTYALTPEDPGIANWLDTAGLRDGFAILRWEVMASPATGEDLLRDVRLVKIADLQNDQASGVPMISQAQRQDQLTQRAVQYLNRLR